MKKKLFFFTNLAFLWMAGICLADSPHQIGPFILNHNIGDLKDYVIMETALPIRHLENIEEVEIKSNRNLYEISISIRYFPFSSH